MRVWMHKETGELAIARKVWLETDFPLPEPTYAIQLSTSFAGYAFENKHGVVMFLPLKACEEFEDLGEL